ncbi:hypothetical protein LF1_12920 [Rubripirellula obstinata]|uniref:DUF3754 domain-containing protein n=2 Tax=Rubripirellula obstinata TaxID=406547 RepID=A0A5B1CGA0_9BACT|nr:hypothetical protein LF1_12920 [Rubripirellula obstinata]
MEGDGPLTRSLIRSPLLESFGEGSTSGFIAEDAAHWAIEAFIPVQPDQWCHYLASRIKQDTGETDDAQTRSNFDQAVFKITESVRQFSSAQQFEFANVYRSIDPDRDTKDLSSPESEVVGDTEPADLMRPQIDAAIELLHPMLDQAGYTRLSQEQIEECVGVASQWGVPLHVDFSLFEQLVVYARGDIIGTRFKRRLRKFYRRESVQVPIYQRMVVMFQLSEDQNADETLVAASLHLRMFKNIPKQDIDMLLPCSRVKISGVDRVKIVLPSLGGFLMSLRKIASYALLFAVLALHWTAILTVLVLGYLVKSTLSYFQTKNRYQLNLNRNLYFQKLDTGAGVGFHLAAQASSQRQVESILAYYAIATHGQPISDRKLRRKCERIVRESINVEIDFQVDRAVKLLVELGLITPTEAGWQVA